MTGLAITAMTAPAVALLAGATWATIWPKSAYWGPVIWRGPADSGRVGLTFDDGPTPGPTERVLDELDRSNARATFFVVGVNVERHPDLLRRIHQQGHLIANHSYHHSHYIMMGRNAYWEREVRRTNELLESILGQSPTLFRPPMGAKTWHTTYAMRQTGSTLVTWSHRAWDGFPTTSRKILKRFENLTGGEILLMHDGVEPRAPHRDRAATIGAIGPLVESMRQRGLEPARLDELLNLEGYRRATAA